MTMWNLLSFNLRSFVTPTSANKPVELPTNHGEYEPLDKFIKENVPEVNEGYWYWNAPTLPNGQLQTVYAAMGNFEQVDKVYYGRRLITFDDGVTVSADYVTDPPESQAKWDEDVKYCPIPDAPRFPVRTRYLRPEEVQKLHTPANEHKPLVILLHGLTGGSHESYLRATITKLTKKFDCVALNSRGCARTKITTPQLFCALLTDDIRRFVKMVKKEQPNRKLYLVGYSLGAAIMANYLGQEGAESEIEAACAVATPWDLNASSNGLHGNWLGKEVYSVQMCNNLKRLLRNNKKTLAQDPHFEEPTGIKYLIDFDNTYTAPYFGFQTASDYYRKASPVNRLLAVRTPMMILNAQDDPVVGDTSVPYYEVRANPYTFMADTTVGGHLGWFQAGGGRWFPDVIYKFFASYHDQVDTTKPLKAEASQIKNLFHEDRLVLNN